jgi:hypothetical protein
MGGGQMDKREFIERQFIREQFISLRDEIKEIKTRIFKLASFGIIGVPAAQYVATIYNLRMLVFALPFLVITVSLLYLSENHALMRSGLYIKRHIEPRYKKDIVGWEEWLEQDDSFERRTVDIFLGYAFFILFSIYYFGTVYMAWNYINDQKIFSGKSFPNLLIVSYIVLGVLYLAYLIKNHRSQTTDTKRKSDV